MMNESLYSDPRFQMLQRLRSSGQWDRVADVSTQLLQDYPDEPFLHREIGRCLIVADREKEALEPLNKALAGDPEDEEALLLKGIALRNLNKLVPAEHCFVKVIEMNPEWAQPRIQLAAILIEQDQFNKAKKTLEQARQLDPEEADVDRLMAVVDDHLLDGRKERRHAIKSHLLKALEKDPTDFSALYQLGMFHLDEERNIDRAIECFRQGLNVDPEDRDLQKGLFRAIGQRDPIFWLLDLPRRGFRSMLSIWSWAWAYKWPLLLLLFIGRYLLAIVIVLGLFWAIWCWPLTKVWEWLCLDDLHREMGRVKLRKGSFVDRMRATPIGLRFGLMVAIFTLAGGFLISMIVIPEVQTALALLFVGCVVMMIALVVWKYLRQLWILLYRRWTLNRDPGKL